MKIVIVGAGAIGRFMGGMLGRDDHEVIFVEKDDAVTEAINRNGIQFVEPGASSREVSLSVKARAVQDAAEIKACDLVILAVKSYHTAAAAGGIRHLVGPVTPVLTIQTGLGNIETLAEILDSAHILGGVTFHGSTSLNGSKVRHAGAGPTLIGEIDSMERQRVEGLKKVFDASGIPTRVTDNIIGHIWAKALVYSAINSLTAILRLKNGQLIGKMESIALAKRLIDEGRQVARAYGVQLPADDLYDSLLEVCHRTSENLSPMLQDILNGRPTEIEALSGAIHAMGEKRGLRVPIHQTLMELIRLIEKWGKGAAI